MTTPIPPLLLLGCGRMGGALLRGWIGEGLAPSFVVDPGVQDPASVPSPHVLVPSLAALPDGAAPSVVVLAVKPQQADPVLGEAGRRFPDALFLSIMAGRTIASLRAGTGAARVVRAMPNTPAAIGRGITGLYAPPDIDPADTALASRLLAAVGEVVTLENEADMDAVTAVSGSGPAHVFLLAELLERAGRRQGLRADIARRLARATVAGAGALLASSEEDAEAMRQAVTSKAGTTERALEVLMADDAWPRLIDAAVAASVARSRELAS